MIYDKDHFISDQACSESYEQLANIDRKSEVHFDKMHYHGDMSMSGSFNFERMVENLANNPEFIEKCKQ